MNPTSPSTPPIAPQPARNNSTKAIWISLIVFIAAIALVVWGIMTLYAMRAGDDLDIVKNGVATQGISRGTAYVGPQKIGRSVTTVYKAYYRYEVDGKSYSVIGEKNYKATENVHEGMKATVHYMADDPDEATVTNEE